MFPEAGAEVQAEFVEGLEVRAADGLFFHEGPDGTFADALDGGGRDGEDDFIEGAGVRDGTAGVDGDSAVG